MNIRLNDESDFCCFEIDNNYQKYIIFHKTSILLSDVSIRMTKYTNSDVKIERKAQMTFLNYHMCHLDVLL